MDTPLFVRFPSPPEGPVLEAHPRGFTVLAGQPVIRNFRYHFAEEGSVTVAAGLWECSPCTWRFRYRHQEFFHIVGGRMRLTPEGGEPMLLGPGEALSIEVGFAGTWEVLETMRKHYLTRYVGS